MSKRLKAALFLLVLLMIPVSAQKLKLTGRTVKPGNMFMLDCQIAEEGSYEVQRSTSVNARFWSAVTNFHALPGTRTVQDPMSGPTRFYRLVRLTNAPVITLDPIGATNYTGTEIRLTATATGSAPLRLRWFKDGRALDAATGTNLALSGPPSLSGAYSLVATNPWGAVTSAVAQVKIVSAVAPTISGKSIRFTIQNAQGDFANLGGGHFTTVFNSQGFYNTSGSTILLNDAGFWQYGALNDNSARILVPNSVTYPNGTFSLTFQDPQNGTYNLAAPGMFGFQSGKFEILD